MRALAPPKVKLLISERIQKYGLPQSWKAQCCALYNQFLTSCDRSVRSQARLIDSILLLICRRKRFIEPKELLKTTRGVRGLGAKESLHFYRVLEELDGLIPATPEEYIEKFFFDNSEYAEFLPKALNIASRIPIKDLRGKNPRILASVCIYLSSIGVSFGVHKPLLTQSEIASYFKVTNVSVMNRYHDLLPKLRGMNTVLTKEEIEWFLSLRKGQLEKT